MANVRSSVCLLKLRALFGSSAWARPRPLHRRLTLDLPHFPVPIFLSEISPSLSATSKKSWPSPQPPSCIIKSGMSTTNKSPGDRAAINRKNAQRSTGPRTPEGKARSSLNAIKHGLSGQTIVSPKEDLVAYCRFARRYFHELKPNAVIETQIVQNLADGSWRLNRDRGFETTLLTLGFDEQSGSIVVDDPEIHCASGERQGLPQQCPDAGVPQHVRAAHLASIRAQSQAP